MDPNQLKTLDPKLREAYERVMSSTAQAASAPPVSSQPATDQPQQASAATPSDQTGHDPLDAMGHASSRFVPDSQMTPPVEQPMPPVQQPEPVAQPVVPPPPVPVANAQGTQAVANEQVHAYVAEEVAGVKNSLKFIQVMYIVGGAVFFIVYALFWMKFFNVASPF